MKYLLASVLLATNLSLAWAEDIQPSPFSARYTMQRGNVVIGEVERSLTTPGADGKYTFTSKMRASGLAAAFVKDQVDEHSLWVYQDNKVKPLQYHYLKSGGKKRRELDLVFDWNNGTVKNTTGDGWELTIDPGAQDKLSYQLALMYDLQQGMTTLEYPIVDKNKLRNYRFKVAGQEQLDTPLGKLTTVKLERIMDSDEKTTFIWCAPSLNYLPVSIEQHEKENGDFKMLIKAVEGLSVPVGT